MSQWTLRAPGSLFLTQSKKKGVEKKYSGKKKKKITSEEERGNLNRNNSMRFFFLPLTAWIQLVWSWKMINKKERKKKKLRKLLSRLKTEHVGFLVLNLYFLSLWYVRGKPNAQSSLYHYTSSGWTLKLKISLTYSGNSIRFFPLYKCHDFNTAAVVVVSVFPFELILWAPRATKSWIWLCYCSILHSSPKSQTLC